MRLDYTKRCRRTGCPQELGRDTKDVVLDSRYGLAVPGNPVDGPGLVAGRNCGSTVKTLYSVVPLAFLVIKTGMSSGPGVVGRGFNLSWLE